MSGAARRRTGETSMLALAGVAVTVFALSYLCLVYKRQTGVFAAVWPANAIVLALLLRSSPSAWRGLLAAGLAGNLLADLTNGDQVLSAALLSATNSLESLACAWLMRRVIGPTVDLSRQRHLLAFLLFGGLVAPLISSLCAVTVVAVTRHTPFLRGLVSWWIQDSLGLLIVTPALLVLSRETILELWRRVRAGQGWLSLSVLALSMAAVFGQQHYPLFFALPPVLILVAFELDLAGAALALLISAVTSVLLTAAGLGPAVHLYKDPIARLNVLESFLAIMTVSVLPVAAALARRDRLEEALRASLAKIEAGQAALTESEARYRLLAESSTDIVLKVDRDDRIEYVSPSIGRYGYDPEALIGRPGFSLVHPDDVGILRALLDELFQSDTLSLSRERSYRILTADGGHVWMEGGPAIIRDRDGAPQAVISQLRDISERRAAIAALTESETRYRMIAENATDVITRAGIDGRFSYLSPSIKAVTGYTPADLIGRSLMSFIHPDDLGPTLAIYRRILAGGKPGGESLRFRVRHKDGHYLWLECNPTLLTDADGEPIELIDVTRDITARVRLEAQLLAARDAAEEATAIKSAFMANMSHEIRTPLTAILGFTSLLARRADLDEAALTQISRVANAGKTLLSIVNEILDFSKLEAGQFEIVPTPVRPEEILRETLLMFTSQAEAKGLDLAFEIEGQMPDCVLIDADRLRQILINLLGNGIKFTDRGSVELTAAYDGEARQLEVRVSDTGPGMTRAQQQKLFQRFSQVDAATTRRHGGTGLGLAICKGLAEVMGGDISVRSRPGRGSVFILRIAAPLADPPLAEPAPVEHDASAMDGLRLLVADDNLVNRELARAILTPFGIEVTEVEDGEAAVRAAGHRAFDAILMDIRMPGLDGPAATALIRRGSGPNRDTPILAFSADVELAAYEAPDSDFDGIVRKPLTSADLVEALARCLGGEETGDEPGGAIAAAPPSGI